MATHARTMYRSSDLCRNSADVFAAAADHPITVTRRDGEPLVLMSEREDHARNELLQLAAQLMGVTTSDGRNVVEFMVGQFPWMLALTPDDQEDCVREVLNAARANFSTGQPHLALSTLTSWRETAEAVAASLGELPVEWIDDDAVSECPSGADYS